MTDADHKALAEALRPHLDKEDISFKKWFRGLFSLKNIIKNHANLIHMVVIVVFWGAVIIGGMATVSWVKAHWFKSEATHQQATTIQDNAGTITQTDNHATNEVIHNHSPLENGLLGLFMGSKDKTQVEKDKTVSK